MAEPTNEHRIGESVLELAKKDQVLHIWFDLCEKRYVVTTSQKQGFHFAQSSVRRFDADKLAEGLAIELPKMIAEVDTALNHGQTRTGHPTRIPEPDK